VERRPESADRRAKLVVPTKRGREVMRLSDEIVRDVEKRLARELGTSRYDDFKKALREVVESLSLRR
jgi:DNA-binding MarR family transcriptional regulator